ncbi:hypothetical protein K449DRAFT_433440 [Hypoxylon sp. EC38]|nr:hypothetical protein K449DRAFT_433440 [Hypoxylon sp. EC38]
MISNDHRPFIHYRLTIGDYHPVRIKMNKGHHSLGTVTSAEMSADTVCLRVVQQYTIRAVRELHLMSLKAIVPPATGPDIYRMRETADLQLGSIFFGKLPLEIREIIYAEYTHPEWLLDTLAMYPSITGTG